MPIYCYRCSRCETCYELLLPAGPPEFLPHEVPCDSEDYDGACDLVRDWSASAPSIGFVTKAGFSPARRAFNRDA